MLSPSQLHVTYCHDASNQNLANILIIKQKLESVSGSCKSHSSKTANIKIYLQIAHTDASDHIYVSQWPVINVKASFCA